jgi:alpha,alpha-trehalase
MTKNDIQKFVDDNFDPEGSEFEEWIPSDWVAKPKFLAKIADPNLREWAWKIHEFWKELGRKIKIDVKNRPDLYSMIYVSNPVIVPGGRFR